MAVAPPPPRRDTEDPELDVAEPEAADERRRKRAGGIIQLRIPLISGLPQGEAGLTRR